MQGMLATVMNALQLQGALEGLGVDTRVQVSSDMKPNPAPRLFFLTVSGAETSGDRKSHVLLTLATTCCCQKACRYRRQCAARSLT